MSLGENIYKLRTQRNMNQEDLADALDVSRQSVSKWENNSAVPELEKLIKMAQIFEITMDELVTGETFAKPEVPSSLPENAVTTNDLVSIVLLILGIALSALMIFTSPTHNSVVLMLLGLYVLPPLVTVGAAFSSPKSRILFYVFIGYNVLFGLLGIIASIQFGPFLCLLNAAALGFWVRRRDNC